MIRRISTFTASVACALLPVIAFADDDENFSLSPQDMARQRKVFGAIAVVIIVLLALYFFRRWQATHSGVTSSGSYRDD